MKFVWLSLALIFTLIALASFILTLIDAFAALDQVGLSRIVQAVGIPAVLLAIASLLWGILFHLWAHHKARERAQTITIGIEEEANQIPSTP